jgi:hypothetical protein
VHQVVDVGVVSGLQHGTVPATPTRGNNAVPTLPVAPVTTMRVAMCQSTFRPPLLEGAGW